MAFVSSVMSTICELDVEARVEDGWGRVDARGNLEALAVGIPLVATSVALTGIGLVDGEHCLVADSGRQFADAMEKVIAAPQEAQARAARARELLADHYSSAAIATRWDEAISYAMENNDQA